MSVLVDTSVSIDHFRSGNPALVAVLGRDLALTHPIVVLEIACGTPPAPRRQTLADVSVLRPCNPASLPEVMAFIEREQLYGLGCGLVDASLAGLYPDDTGRGPVDP